MADIFISYSRNDSAKALSLAEQLRATGMDVWIDQHGIEGATSWSKEIANALQACHTMLLLLSPTAVTSKNVAKELSVATQLNKRIVPIQLVRTQLEGEFLYHLASLQRVKIEDFDSIVRAISGTERSVRVSRPVQMIDDRKSLMILPFEDLSPTGDNGWFADGIVSELINALSNVKSLRLMDTQATKEFKSYKGQLTTYAATMQIRYFVQGDVRKFGDQIKISARLLDIESGDFLWQDALKGTMNDIFDIQEQVAEKVVTGLKLHLASDERAKLATRSTENAEAYELYLRAFDYYWHGTKESREYALRTIGMSLELDPTFALAKLRRAVILITNYLSYGSNPDMVAEAERLLNEARTVITPEEDWRVLEVQALLADVHGDKESAEVLRKENYRIAPNEIQRLQPLSQLYMICGRPKDIVPLVDHFLALSPADYHIARIIMNMGWALNDQELLLNYIREYDFLSIYLKRLRMMPDDDDARATYGMLLLYLGRVDDARTHLGSIHDWQITSIVGCHNAACLAAQLDEPDRAIRWLRQIADFNENVEFPNIMTDRELEPLHAREDFQLLLEERKRRLKLIG